MWSTRRVITEWGIAISLVFAISLVLAWTDSLVLGSGREALALGEGVYMRTIPGYFCLSSELGADWKPVSDEKGRRFWMATHRYRAWFFPGIEYHDRQYTSGLTVWSVEVAFWIPLLLLTGYVVICLKLRPRPVRPATAIP
jgi:hypothetical protein